MIISLNSNLNNLKIKSVPFTLTSDTTYKACFTSQEDFEQKSGVPYSKIVWLGAYCTNTNTQPNTYINKNNNVFTITNLPTANKTYNFWVTIIYK